MSQPDYPNVEVHIEDAEAFLIDLRDSGEINMLGAVPHIEAEFDISRVDAKAILMWWIQAA